jgi:hypothetical protein
VGEGTILVPTDQVPDVRALLPRGVSVVSSEPYGGAVRVTITGNQVDEGADYQFVVTDEPLSRTVELVKNETPSA